jgi:glycosyltransferase involved in cell wall biosynthesis
MPSYAEGYGLPIVEALAAGTPVIASDIEVFREVGGTRVTYCRLGDIEAWLTAVRTHAASQTSQAPMTEAENRAAWDSYFKTISSFIGDL